MMMPEMEMEVIMAFAMAIGMLIACAAVTRERRPHP
jgi:hypothetical protein